MTKQILRFTLNGRQHQMLVSPMETLARILRETLDLTGTKLGCGKGECGSCTVLINGSAQMSCITLALSCEGKSVETIEGLAQADQLHPLQKSFIKHGAVQCGFCTPGVIMSAKELYDSHTQVSKEQIQESISAHLCRCTGYSKINKAIEEAFRERELGHE